MLRIWLGTSRMSQRASNSYRTGSSRPDLSSNSYRTSSSRPDLSSNSYRTSSSRPDLSSNSYRTSSSRPDLSSNRHGQSRDSYRASTSGISRYSGRTRGGYEKSDRDYPGSRQDPPQGSRYSYEQNSRSAQSYERPHRSEREDGSRSSYGQASRSSAAQGYCGRPDDYPRNDQRSDVTQSRHVQSYDRPSHESHLTYAQGVQSDTRFQSSNDFREGSTERSWYSQEPTLSSERPARKSRFSDEQSVFYNIDQGSGFPTVRKVSDGDNEQDYDQYGSSRTSYMDSNLAPSYPNVAPSYQVDLTHRMTVASNQFINIDVGLSNTIPMRESYHSASNFVNPTMNRAVASDFTQGSDKETTTSLDYQLREQANQLIQLRNAGLTGSTPLNQGYSSVNQRPEAADGGRFRRPQNIPSSQWESNNVLNQTDYDRERSGDYRSDPISVPRMPERKVIVQQDDDNQRPEGADGGRFRRPQNIPSSQWESNNALNQNDYDRDRSGDYRSDSISEPRMPERKVIVHQDEDYSMDRSGDHIPNSMSVPKMPERKVTIVQQGNFDYARFLDSKVKMSGKQRHAMALVGDGEITLSLSSRKKLNSLANMGMCNDPSNKKLSSLFAFKLKLPEKLRNAMALVCDGELNLSKNSRKRLNVLIRIGEGGGVAESDPTRRRLSKKQKRALKNAKNEELLPPKLNVKTEKKVKLKPSKVKAAKVSLPFHLTKFLPGQTQKERKLESKRKLKAERKQATRLRRKLKKQEKKAIASKVWLKDTLARNNLPVPDTTQEEVDSPWTSDENYSDTVSVDHQQSPDQFDNTERSPAYQLRSISRVKDENLEESTSNIVIKIENSIDNGTEVYKSSAGEVDNSQVMQARDMTGSENLLHVASTSNQMKRQYSTFNDGENSQVCKKRKGDFKSGPAKVEPKTTSPNLKQKTKSELLPLISKRHWEYTHFGNRFIRETQQGYPNCFSFNIVSYNLLAQNLLQDNSNLYAGCEPSILEWDFRKWNLLQEIKAIEADVLCLQEVHAEHYESFYEPQLKELGFIGYFVKRTRDKQDGCATFVRHSKFDIVSSHPVNYYKEGCSLMNRDNIGLVSVVKPKVNGLQLTQNICVGNTHLLFNPKRGDIKLLQIGMLLAELDKHAFRGFKSHNHNIYDPVLLCGDLNARPFCPLYDMIVKGHYQYEGKEAAEICGPLDTPVKKKHSRRLGKSLFTPHVGITQLCQHEDIASARYRGLDPAIGSLYSGTDSGGIGHVLNLRSVYSPYRSRGSRWNGEPNEVTTHHGKTSCAVDYIFHNGNNEKQAYYSNKLSVIGKYSLLTIQDCKRMGTLPNSVISSDHFMLAAKFCLLAE